ncbi:hypothetical protein [Homoserinimonas sedimenticola]|uniref:hypothetical protein n=1 Tax=Homoserinimonas sedimenticola TaxID=2986805 RepID=UPI0027E34348|nr:hypothetical protein [Salinibacterium sedimenticola]
MTRRNSSRPGHACTATAPPRSRAKIRRSSLSSVRSHPPLLSRRPPSPASPPRSTQPTRPPPTVTPRQTEPRTSRASAQGQVVLTRLVTEASSKAFDALGASALRRSLSFDRHWRNARAVSSHNPTAYKARIVGDWEVNSTPPPFIWAIGASTAHAKEPE